MITSPSNPTVKAIRALRQRRARAEQGRYLAEGIRLVAEALQLGAPVEALVVAPELLGSEFARRLVADHAAAGGQQVVVSADVFATIAEREGPQGLAAILRPRWHGLAELPAAPAGWLALVEVADPGNLGAILRAADGAGFGGAILVGATTDPYDPAALRAAMGATFAQRLARASWPELLAWRRERDLYMLGSSDQGAQDYRATRTPTPPLLLLGSERQGLSAEQLAACDAVLRIPMRGRSDSLNLAVAAGVLMYELTRDAP